MQFGNPTANGWKQTQLIKEIIAYIVNEIKNSRSGPFTIRHGPEWDMYLDDDYNPLDNLEEVAVDSPNAGTINKLVERINSLSAKASNKTLRQRIKEMAEIADVVMFTSRNMDFELQIVRQLA